MIGYLAVVLVCAAGTAQQDCTRETALDLMVRPADTLFQCMFEGPIAARTFLGEGNVLRVVCERREG